MRFSDILKLSLRMFRARTMRTLLTILGMSIGIAAILFLVSLGYGLQKTLLQRITTSDALATLDIAEDRAKNALIDQASIEKIRALPGVTATIPAVRVRGQGKFESVTLDLDTLGSSETFLRLENLKILSGRLLSTEAKTIVLTSGIGKTFGKSPEEMIGKEFSLTLFLPVEGKEGQTVAKGPEVFRVIGIV